MTVYVSTACLKDGKDVIQVLDAYKTAGFRHIELGASHRYSPGLVPYVKRQSLDFLVHHYFPPPADPFVLNLASASSEILNRSLQQINRSLELCYEIGAPLLSIHAGFKADPSPDLTFIGRRQEPYEKAFDIFVTSIKEIDHLARENGVKVAIENNVLARYNMVDGANPYLLLCHQEEFKEFFKRVTSDNVGILLDLGHLQVSAHSLGFSKDEFVRDLGNRIFALHIHDNRGEKDEHLGVTPGSWVYNALHRPSFSGIPWILESTNLSVDQIKQNLNLLGSLQNYMFQNGQSVFQAESPRTQKNPLCQ